jgi:hypothetical protein
MKNNKFALALLLVPVVFLPSCFLTDLFKAKEHKVEGTPVVSMKGKVVITDKSYDNEFAQLLEENPHLQSVIALMPEAKQNFLNGLVNQEVVSTWVAENKIDQSEEYKKEMERMSRSVKRMLDTKYFGLKHPVQVSEAELTEFYDKNKDVMPDLMISRGGIKAAGVSFDKELDAKAFLAKVKEVKDISKAATLAKVNKNFRDFKLVNAQSLGIDAQLRDKIVETAQVPSTSIIKVDNTFWVVSATEKEQVKYRPFEQVKAGLEQYVTKEKRMQVFEAEIEKLKKEYNVVVDNSAFKAAEESKLAQAEQPAEQVAEQKPETAQVA